MTDKTPKQSLLRRLRIPLLIYIVCAGAYLGTAAGRLSKPSSDNHYVYLAQNLLQGRLSLDGSPPHQNDWALVTELELNDGSRVRGTFLRTGGTGRFKTTDGRRMIIGDAEIRSRKHVYYVSFPVLPALLMMPFVAIWGMKFNDVIFTALVAAFNPVLLYWILRRLSAIGLSLRTRGQDLWLVALFAFGTAHFSASVMGQVWFTAHVVGVGVTGWYVLAALEGRHPVLAGLCLGLGFITRTPIPFLFPLLVGEVLRRNLAPPPEGAEAGSGDAPTRRPELWPWIRALWPRVAWGKSIKQLLAGFVPAAGVASGAFVLNYLRFDDPLEFGHYYLNVRWAERIQRWGLFNYHFLARNLAVMLTLLPKILRRAPYIKIPWHGLGIFFTTPVLLYVVWPRRRCPVQPWLYLSILPVAILHLLYQNSGWVQFSYRFSLDYMVLLMALLAVGGNRMGLLFKALVVYSVGVHTFGAVTLNRYMNFYEDFMFPVP
jgi:hypothetical protein